MKKLLVYLIVFFSLFYFIDIVKAASAGSLQLDSSTFDLIKPLSSYSSSEYDIETSRQQVINKLNINSETDDYLLYLSGKYLYGYKWSKDTNFIYYPGLTFGSYNSSTTSNYLYLYFYFQTETAIPFVTYDMSTSSISSSTTINGFTMANYRIINGGKVIKRIYQNDGSRSTKYFESSFDISYNTSGMNGSYYEPINICNEDLCYQFYEGDILLKANGDLNIGPVIPEISFESINKYDDNELIKINFSIFDTDKYLYFYRTSNDNEYTWIEINQNDYYYQSYTNCNLYVIAIDKEKYVESAENGQELVYDIVSSSTYTFSQLNETIPELSFNTTIPDSCYLTVSDKENIICKSLTINILNNYSTEKYLWEYSKDNVNFIPIFTDSLTNIYSENITLYFRLLDKQKNEYIKYSSYKLYGITITSSELGPYIKLNGRYDKEKILYEITAYFYNKDFDNYNYFYTIDKNNWTQIQESQLNVYSGSIYNKIFNIYNNCTFIIKIEDKNGNYVNSFTFTVDFDKYFNDTLPVNKISSFLNNTSEEIKTISELIQYFYDGLDSRIQDFLIAIYTIILICSIIVLARS